MRSERPLFARARAAAATPMVAVASMAVALVAPLVVGCEDPTKDAIIAELGDETKGVPVGPLHRPGQPCIVCHDGETARALAVAGTVFWTVTDDSPAPGTKVTLIDEDAHEQVAFTNCAGNFFVLPEELKVKTPFWVTIGEGETEIPMDSPVNGDGSCASCHGVEPGAQSAGRVYLYENPPGAPPENCP